MKFNKKFLYICLLLTGQKMLAMLIFEPKGFRDQILKYNALKGRYIMNRKAEDKAAALDILAKIQLNHSPILRSTPLREFFRANHTFFDTNEHVINPDFNAALQREKNYFEDPKDGDIPLPPPLEPEPTTKPGPTKIKPKPTTGGGSLLDELKKKKLRPIGPSIKLPKPTEIPTPTRIPGPETEEDWDTD